MLDFGAFIKDTKRYRVEQLSPVASPKAKVPPTPVNAEVIPESRWQSPSFLCSTAVGRNPKNEGAMHQRAVRDFISNIFERFEN